MAPITVGLDTSRVYKKQQPPGGHCTDIFGGYNTTSQAAENEDIKNRKTKNEKFKNRNSKKSQPSVCPVTGETIGHHTSTKEEIATTENKIKEKTTNGESNNIPEKKVDIQTKCEADKKSDTITKLEPVSDEKKDDNTNTNTDEKENNATTKTETDSDVTNKETDKKQQKVEQNLDSSEIKSTKQMPGVSKYCEIGSSQGIEPNKDKQQVTNPALVTKKTEINPTFVTKQPETNPTLITTVATPTLVTTMAAGRGSGVLSSAPVRNRRTPPHLHTTGFW